MTTSGSDSDWRRNQVAVTLAAFIGFTGFTLVMPFLPLYFEQLGVHDLGDVAIWSGISLGVTPAITAAMAPVWARVADRYGRKLMVARSLASFAVIMSLMALVDAPWQVFTLRAIQGLFAGYGAIAMTMAAESAPAEHVATAIGWVQSAQRLGPALGPVIGGVLAGWLGLRHAFYASALVYVAAFGGTLHFWQLVKADTTEPWRWAAGFAVLFGIRLWWAYRPRWATAIPNAQRPTPNYSQRPTSKNSQP